MAGRNITSANSKVKLFSALTPAGIDFEQYSADSAWTKEMQTVIQSRKGVDGKISFGYDASVVRTLSFVFQPNSPTLDKLNLIMATQNTSRSPIVCQLVIEIPSIGYTFTCENFACINDTILGAGAKVLEPVTVSFEGEEIYATKI